MSKYKEGTKDYIKEKEDHLPHIKDMEWIESIKKHLCPYDNDYETPPHLRKDKGKWMCTWCDFILQGDYKLLAYTKDYPIPEQKTSSTCDECGQPTFYDQETRETICSACGLVIEENPYMNEIEVDGKVRFIGEATRRLNKDRTLI